MRRSALGFIAGLTMLGWVASVSAASQVDLFNAGARTESVQAGGVGVQDLKRGVLYGASTFPLKIAVRPSDALWRGGQTQARTYRFVVLQHRFVRNAQGKISVWGGGEMEIETATGKTGTVAQTISHLLATPKIDAQAPVSTHVAGFKGEQFDATVTGAEPGEGGEAFVPFSGSPQPGGDHVYVKKGTKLRIIAVAARGKTVVIFEQPAEGGPAKGFTGFVTAATNLLRTMVLGTKT